MYGRGYLKERLLVHRLNLAAGGNLKVAVVDQGRHEFDQQLVALVRRAGLPVVG